MLKIEKATVEDIDHLLVLLQEQFLEHEIRFSNTQLKTAIRQLLTQEGLGFVLTAREKDQLLGFAVISFAWTLEHGGKSAWLDELYVLPDFRNAGIGTTLIEQVIIEAEKSACLAIDLEVDDNHQRAANLYERKGFHRLKRSRWAKSLC
jgi:ribosomal protein S18 acetylase RimI-like enzyme